MNHKSHIVLIALGVILLLFVAGCGGGDDISLKDSPFIGGSQGLEIKFLQGAPPDEITDDSFPFQAIVSIKNVGEYNGKDGKGLDKSDVRVDLLGILPSDFKGINAKDPVIRNAQPADKPTARQKDSEGNIIEAVETFATFPRTGAGNGMPAQLQLTDSAIKGNTKFTFRADVCYKYETKVIGSICVLSNMIDIADDAICNPKGSRQVSSSGSPVRVTAFRQSAVGSDRIQFSFDIVHSGSGSVFKHENLDIEDTTGVSRKGCPKDPSNRRIKKNKLEVEVNTGIDDRLTCVGIGDKPGGGIVSSKDVRLTDGKRTITCTQTVPARDFKKNIDIFIRFNYLDSIDKVVLAKHLMGVTRAGDGEAGSCDRDGVCEDGESFEGGCIQDCQCTNDDGDPFTDDTACTNDGKDNRVDKGDRCVIDKQTCKFKSVSGENKCFCSA